MNKVKIGVAGLGRVGWSKHCSAVAKSDKSALIAAMDPLAERCKEAESTYACKAYTSFTKFLEHPGLEAVIIASPSAFHKSMTLAALKAKKHVMVEKPMALSYKDANTMLMAAKKHRRILTIHQNQRAAAYFQHILAVLRSGKIGTPYYVRTGATRFVRRDDWQSLKKHGGGLLNNHAPHSLDQVLQITGYDISRVYCRLLKVVSLGDAEDYVKIALETKSGMTGELDFNAASPMAQLRNSIIINGTRGMLCCDRDHFHMKYFRPGDMKAKPLRSSLTDPNRKYPRDSIKFIEKKIMVNSRYAVNVHKDFAEAIRTRRKPFVLPEEAVNLTKILDWCRRESKGVLTIKEKKSRSGRA